MAELVRLLDLPADASIADIGAGTGNYANALAAAGYRVQAIEPSATMRAQATARSVETRWSWSPMPIQTWRPARASA